MPGFTNCYNVSKLVFYELGEDIAGAIGREKQIKAGSRQKKIDLINRFNPQWRDLYDEISMFNPQLWEVAASRYALLAMTTM
ncbi:MAG TPA: hypothetical protein VGR70_02440 [Stellaceae bacterium]|nr:hypothetical protein [Stellaceae bacterium]